MYMTMSRNSVPGNRTKSGPLHAGEHNLLWAPYKSLENRMYWYIYTYVYDDVPEFSAWESYQIRTSARWGT